MAALAEQAKLAHTLQCAVTALAGQASLLRIAAGSLTETPDARDVFDELIKRQESLGPWALEVQGNDNHAINLPGVINMWITLEAAIEDVCISMILHDPAAVTKLQTVNSKLSDVPPKNEDEARRAYEKTLLRLKTHGLVQGLMKMLSLLGLRPSLQAETENRLNELNYVRNCALHRNCIVESRKTLEAPTLPFPVGATLVISDAIFLRYYDGVGDLLCALHNTLK